MAHYNFGVYHWRERLETVAFALGIAALSVLLRRTSTSRRVRLGAFAALCGGGVGVAEPVRRMLVPPPWALDRDKYDRLATALPFERAEHALDIGCGTGRSLVGFAPHIPRSCTVVGLDVFDSRVILGNGPALARRNGRVAGIDVSAVVGDCARLPITTDSQDVVTAARVLHDLPTEAVGPALREAHRVCAPDGVLGVLELPITPGDTTASPEAYWRERIAEAGFEIESVERVARERRDDRYVLVVATP